MRMFGGDIHKQMPFTHVHGADDFARQSGFTRKRH